MLLRSFLSITLVLLVTACQENPFWVGKQEYFTVEYSNSGFPRVTEPIDASPFISVDNMDVRNLGNGTVEVIANGVRIESAFSKFEITDINIFEKDGNRFEEQFEFTETPSNSKNDIAVVLVLDMSTSLEDLVNDLKSYAKDFIDQVVASTPGSRVAVVFFSDRDKIQATPFFGANNVDVLKALVDNYTDYQPRTAVFEAVSTGISILNSLSFVGSKALVVFTDGGDNASDNKDLLKSQIANSPYLRIAIGLKGNDFRKDELEDMADSRANTLIVTDRAGLQKAFDEVGKQVVSVYRIVYERSDQLLSSPIQIKFNFDVQKIE